MRFHWTSGFKRQYKKLPVKIQQRVQDRFAQFVLDEFDPTLNNHKLSGELSSCRSINITGDYRVVYEKIDADLVCLIAIGTHAELYG